MNFFTNLFRDALEANPAVLDGAAIRLVLFRTSPTGEATLDYTDMPTVEELTSVPGWVLASEQPTNPPLAVTSAVITGSAYILFSSFLLTTLTKKVEVSALGFQYVGTLGGETDPLIMVTDQSFDGHQRVLDKDDEITAFADPALSGQRWLMAWTDNVDGAIRAGSLTSGDIAVSIGPPDFQTAHHFDVWMYPQRVNYIANPSFEAIDNIYWGTNAVFARVESPFGGFCGSFSLEAAADAAVNTWTAHATPEPVQDWSGLAWSPELGLLVSVGYTSDLSAGAVMTSPDGVNWTAQTVPALYWFAATWAAELGLFVAVSGSGTTGDVMTSPDGINWTQRTTPSTDYSWYGICWAPELSLFVATSGYLLPDGYSDGNDKVMTSPDGINWTLRTLPVSGYWYSICWSPERSMFVMAGGNEGIDNLILMSPNGIDWTYTAGPPNIAFSAMVWAAELDLFVVVGQYYGAVRGYAATSPDGVTWTPSLIEEANEYNGLAWSPELGVLAAVAGNGPVSSMIATSSDGGVTWQSAAASADNNWYVVVWAAELGIFAAIGYAGDNNRVMTSQPFKEFGVVVESNTFPTPTDEVWTVQLLARGEGTLSVGFVYWDETYSQTAVDWGEETWELMPDAFVHVRTLRHLSESVEGMLRLQVTGNTLDIDKVLVEPGALIDWPYFDGDEQYGARDDFSWYGTQGASYSLWYNNKNSIVSRLFTKPGYSADNVFTEKDSAGDGLVYDWVPAGTIVDHHLGVLYPYDQKEPPTPKTGVLAEVTPPPV